PPGFRYVVIGEQEAVLAGDKRGSKRIQPELWSATIKLQCHRLVIFPRSVFRNRNWFARLYVLKGNHDMEQGNGRGILLNDPPAGVTLDFKFLKALLRIAELLNESTASRRIV